MRNPHHDRRMQWLYRSMLAAKDERLFTALEFNRFAGEEKQKADAWDRCYARMTVECESALQAVEEGR